MLSDEEWKAIKKVKYICDKWYDENLEIDVKWLESLLSLCEKQQKEIEELKMQLEVEKIDNKYNQEEASEEMISRYKIKAKIEELEKQDRENRMSHNYLVIPVLQSLLEKE